MGSLLIASLTHSNVPPGLTQYHEVQERTAILHPDLSQLAVNPFHVYQEEDERLYWSPKDLEYEEGSMPGDDGEVDDPTWWIYCVLALKYDSDRDSVFCIVDWGDKHDMYRYQELEFIQIEDEEMQGLIYGEIGDRATLEQYPNQWFWATPKAEDTIRKAFF